MRNPQGEVTGGLYGIISREVDWRDQAIGLSHRLNPNPGERIVEVTDVKWLPVNVSRPFHAGFDRRRKPSGPPGFMVFLSRGRSRCSGALRPWCGSDDIY